MDYEQEMERIREQTNAITTARLGELVRSFVRLTADLHNLAAEGSELREKAFELHRSAARLADESGLKKGMMADDIMCPDDVAQAREVARLRKEVKRLEGGGLPAKVLAEQQKTAQALSDARGLKERVSEMAETLRSVANLVDEYADSRNY